MRHVLLVSLSILLLLTACERPMSTVEPYIKQNPFTPEAAAHLCISEDLQTSSSAHEEAGVVTLGVTLINQSQNACNLQSPPQASLRNAGQTLDVEIIHPKADAPTLKISPGESIILAMTWRNYCGESLKTTLDIFLALTEGDSLTVKSELAVFPRCEDKDAPSTLTINPYSYPP